MNCEVLDNFLMSEFQKRVEADRIKIDNSGLEKVNNFLYEELKGMFDELDLKINEYYENLGSVQERELKNLHNEIMVLFEFYMWNEGAKKVAISKVEYVRENIEKIGLKLNDYNYREIEQELKAALKLYKNVFKGIVSSSTLNILINSIKYRIFKYKFQDYIIDENADLAMFIPFVFQDIKRILDDTEVSEDIKTGLHKYLMDKYLILQNFDKVMALIVLGENKKDVNSKYIPDYIKSTRYYEGSLIIDKNITFSGVKLEDRLRPNVSTIINYLHSGNKDKQKYAIEMFISLYECFDEEKFFDNLLEETSSVIKYFIQSLCVYGNYPCLLRFRCYAIKKGFNYNYETDCAIIADKDKLRPDILAHYVSITENECLTRYILKRDDKKDFIDGDFLAYLLKPRNIELFGNYFNGVIKIEGLTKVVMTVEDIIKVLDIILAKSEDKDEENKVALLGLFKTPMHISMREVKIYLLKKLVAYNDEQLIIHLITPSICDLVLGLIGDEALKKRVLDYFYRGIRNKEAASFYGVISSNVTNHKEITKEMIDNLNIFEAAYISRCNDKDFDVVYFVKKHYNSRLCWNNILQGVTNSSLDTKMEVWKYYYLSGKDEVLKTFRYGKELDSNFKRDFAKKMIADNSSLITDFLEFLSPDDIQDLDQEILDLFCRDYRINEIKDRSFSEQIDKVLGRQNNLLLGLNYNQIFKFLVFVMHEGLANNEILVYKDELENTNFKQLLLMAVQNVRTKYLRPAFLLQVMNEDSSLIDWDKIIVADEDLIDGEGVTQEACDFRKKRYYGDLLKLLDVAPNFAKIRIVKAIAKSGIREYINYVKVNYPLFVDLLMDNIIDESILSEMYLENVVGPLRS